MADKRKPDAHPSDKFILAMIVMAVFLFIIIGGGFIRQADFDVAI